MNLSDLLKVGSVRKTKKNDKRALDELNAAERDLAVSEKNVKINPDWALAIAYNAMLNATRALMSSDGFEPSGVEKHKSCIDYAMVKFGSTHGETISLFDRMRKKRHTIMYDMAGVVSEHEAKSAIKTARDFVELVKKKK